MDEKDTSKYPRLYTDQNLMQGGTLEVIAAGHHYLRNVMRSKAGDHLRFFNGSQGEWLCEVTAVEKKKTTLKVSSQLREQNQRVGSVHLYFAPIKKQRMDTLIEKAVELGVTDLTPVITNYTENRKFNAEKMKLHVIEAAEQSERLMLPTLHEALSFDNFLKTARNHTDAFYFPLERYDAAPINQFDIKAPCGFLIGPEGGFSEEEKERITALSAQRKEAEFISEIVSLGPYVLRSETAALFCLSQVTL